MARTKPSPAALPESVCRNCEELQIAANRALEFFGKAKKCGCDTSELEDMVRGALEMATKVKAEFFPDRA